MELTYVKVPIIDICQLLEMQFITDYFLSLQCAYSVMCIDGQRSWYSRSKIKKKIKDQDQDRDLDHWRNMGDLLHHDLDQWVNFDDLIDHDLDH